MMDQNEHITSLMIQNRASNMQWDLWKTRPNQKTVFKAKQQNKNNLMTEMNILSNHITNLCVEKEKLLAESQKLQQYLNV